MYSNNDSKKVGRISLPAITSLADSTLLKHFLRLFTPLALLLMAIAYTLISHDIELHVQQHIHKEEASLEVAASTVLRDIQTIQRDIRYLSNTPAIADFFADRGTADLDLLDQTLLAVSKAAFFYDQIRLLNSDGMEISRVNRANNTSIIVPRQELQQKGHRYYLTEAMAVRDDSIYISPLDLNIEHNKLEIPHKPVIRFVAVHRDSQGDLRGFLVFNYLADTMLTNLRRITAHSPADFLFINRNGDLLQAPSQDDEWGFMFGNPGLFANRQPVAWGQMTAHDSGVFKDGSGLYVFRAIYPRRHTENIHPGTTDSAHLKTAPLESSGMRWLLVSRLSPDSQKAIFHKNIEYAYLLLLTLLIILALGCLLISKGRQEKESELTKNAAIASSSYEAIIMMDHNGNVSFWNPAAQRIFGYSPVEAMGENIHGLIVPPQHRQRFQDNFTEFTKTGRGNFVGTTREVTALRKNGEEFPVELSLNAVRINKQWQGVALLRDISARKKVDEHLRKLSLAVEESPVSIVITDKGGRIEYVNPKFCEISQYSKEEAIGANPRILKSEYQSPEHYQEMWRTLTAGKEWHGEFANRKKDGELYWERASISPVRDAEGNITHFVAIKEDISREKKALDNLQKAKEEAEQANRAKSDFVANMSHEIRTPMNAIIGFSELALDLEMAAEPKNYFRKIHQAGRSLLSIINDILDFSKIEAGELSLAPRSFNLNAIFDGLANLFSSKMWEKNLELLFQIDEDVPRSLIADDMRLTQVLVNLIGNALKFTEKGEILVSVQKISVTTGSATLRFSVKDSGIGIDPQKIDALFSPFQQADSSISRSYGGTGLGLTISKQLVELMGGQLHVTSEPGHGSTFFFSLPCRLPETIAANMCALPDELRGARVLVADDNESVGKILGDFLRYFSLRPTVVSSGQAALDALTQAGEADPFSLLLIDWQMPGINGLETCTLIRSDPGQARLPIILLSGWNPQNFAREAEGKVDAILSKPVTAPLLFKSIMTVLGYEQEGAATPGEITLVPRKIPPGASLLLVEDNIINREVALKILRRAGFRVEAVNNGKEAVAAVTKRTAAGQKPFAAILMDLQMPEMDGYEATRQIRQLNDPKVGSVPIIAMTAQAFVEDRQRCLAAGMDDFISKPIDQDLLFATLARHITDIVVPSPGRTVSATGNTAVQSNQRVIDINKVLERIGGNRVFLNELLQLFSKEYSTVDTLIQVAHDKGDRETAGRLAHTITGIAANIGGEELAARARTLQLAIAGEGDFNGAFNAFAAALREMLTAIRIISAQPPMTAVDDPQADSNQEQLVELFGRLIDQLNQNSYGCLGTVKEIQATIPMTHHNEQLAKLCNHVEKYQYQQALAIAVAMQEALTAR